ncbi:hypothetical protein [Microcoleus sp. BR0-C5]
MTVHRCLKQYSDRGLSDK